MRDTSKRSGPDLDPLYVIFEQHLFNFEDSDADRKTFIFNIIREYLTHLRRLQIAIPSHMEPHIVEELFAQVNTMLVKKIYGCLSLDEYRKGVTSGLKRKARARYVRLKKASPRKRKAA